MFLLLLVSVTLSEKYGGILLTNRSCIIFPGAYTAYFSDIRMMKTIYLKLKIKIINFIKDNINLNQNKFKLLMRSRFLFPRQTESDPGCSKTIIIIERNRQRNCSLNKIILPRYRADNVDNC